MGQPVLELQIERLCLVADSECKIERSLPATKPTSSISKPTYNNRHPEVQEKVREELHRVLGTDRQPTLADRANLPLTDATVMEIQRVANVCKLD